MIRLNRPRKLDTNWVYIGSGCYENNDGLRIHIGGLIICIADKPKETMFRVNEFSDTIYIGCLKVMGWKRKRALMLYAEYYHEVNKPTLLWAFLIS